MVLTNNTNGTNSNIDCRHKLHIYYTENNSNENDIVIKSCCNTSMDISNIILNMIYELTKDGRILDGRIVIELPEYTTTLYPTYNMSEPITKFERLIFNGPNTLFKFIKTSNPLVQNNWFDIDINRYLNYFYTMNTTIIMASLRDLAKDLDSVYLNDPITWIDKFIQGSSKLGHVICSDGKCVYHTFSHDLYDYKNPRHTLIFISDKSLPIFLGSRSLTRNEILESGKYEVINEYNEIRKFDQAEDTSNYTKDLYNKLISHNHMYLSNINISNTYHDAFDDNGNRKGFEYMVKLNIDSSDYVCDSYLYMSQAINSKCKNPHSIVYDFDILDCSGKVYCKPKYPLSDKAITKVTFANRINLIPLEPLNENKKEETKND